MSGGGIDTALVRTQIALARVGPINLAICMLFMAAAAAWFRLLPDLHAETARLQHALVQSRQAAYAAGKPAAPAPRSRNQERLQTFRDMLGEKRYEEQQIKTLFAIAGKTGLALERAEYKSAFVQSGRYRTYKIALPVSGTYPAIRAFCEQALLAIPFASLDALNFKRDAIGSNIVEAQLYFTLHLADSGETAPRDIVVSHGAWE